MRAVLVGMIMACAVGIWLTFEAESLQEEISLCNSEAVVEFYKRRCRMEVVDDYPSGALLLLIVTQLQRPV